MEALRRDLARIPASLAEQERQLRQQYNRRRAATGLYDPRNFGGAEQSAIDFAREQAGYEAETGNTLLKELEALQTKAAQEKALQGQATEFAGQIAGMAGQPLDNEGNMALEGLIASRPSLHGHPLVSDAIARIRNHRAQLRAQQPRPTTPQVRLNPAQAGYGWQELAKQKPPLAGINPGQPGYEWQEWLRQ